MGRLVARTPEFPVQRWSGEGPITRWFNYAIIYNKGGRFQLLLYEKKVRGSNKNYSRTTMSPYMICNLAVEIFMLFHLNSWPLWDRHKMIIPSEIEDLLPKEKLERERKWIVNQLAERFKK